jgi:hypothetical protein
MTATELFCAGKLGINAVKRGSAWEEHWYQRGALVRTQLPINPKHMKTHGFQCWQTSGFASYAEWIRG